MDYSKKITNKIYFATTTVIDWIDVFTRPVYKDIIVESLKYCSEKKGLIIYGWVLMTNHLHLLVGCDEELSISDILRDFKSYTSKEIKKAIKLNVQESRRDWMLQRFIYAGNFDNKHNGFVFWQQGNHLTEITSFNFFKQKLNYIHQNPVRQGFVTNPEDYLYSSAFGYNTNDGLLKIQRDE